MINELRRALDALASTDLLPDQASGKAKTDVDEAPGPMMSGWAISSLLVQYSAQHVYVLSGLLDPAKPVAPLACCTCVRSMLEACAQVAWLCDPDIDLRKRVERVLALRFNAIVEQQKAVRLTKEPVDGSHLEALIKEAESLGHEVREKNGKPIGIGSRVPGATDMIRDMLDYEFLYRVLSGAAHGQHWAVRDLGFRVVEQDGVVVSMEAHADATVLATLGLAAGESFGKALSAMRIYAGQPVDEVTELVMAVAEPASKMGPRQD